MCAPKSSTRTARHTAARVPRTPGGASAVRAPPIVKCVGFPVTFPTVSSFQLHVRTNRTFDIQGLHSLRALLSSVTHSFILCSYFSLFNRTRLILSESSREHEGRRLVACPIGKRLASSCDSWFRELGRIGG